MNLYLMDTDFDMNSEFDRVITHQLYGGDWENRIKQEYLLGIGGILMLKKLGIHSELYHCNEGHAALLNLQRLVDYVQEQHLDFNVALELVRASSLYTVHTPCLPVMTILTKVFSANIWVNILPSSVFLGMT